MALEADKAKRLAARKGEPMNSMALQPRSSRAKEGAFSTILAKGVFSYPPPGKDVPDAAMGQQQPRKPGGPLPQQTWAWQYVPDQPIPAEASLLVEA